MQILCLLFTLLSAAVAVQKETKFSHTITVDGNGISNSSCWHGWEPCTLELALEGAHHFNSSVMISIHPGQYNLSDNSYNLFENTHDISIVGNITSVASYSNHSSIIVRCLPGAGLSFVNVSSIKIQNIVFDRCGALHNSTSRDFMEPEILPYLEFQAALYLLFCRDLHLSGIKIVDSIGTGMAIFDTTGNNTIENSEFKGNKVPCKSTKMPGGGGVYIEFSYCVPGDMSCGNGYSNISSHYVSNATYKISECLFTENSASTGEFKIRHYLYQPGKNSFTFGKGGGLALIFRGRASGNYITVESCNITNNQAEIGGGMYTNFGDDSQNNTVNMMSSHVIANNCFRETVPPLGGSNGGGVTVYYLLDGNKTHNNSITFFHCEIRNNSAYYGGGAAVTSTSVKEITAFTNTAKFISCKFSSNIARTGSAIDVFHWFSVTSTNTTGVTAILNFHNCTFTDNGGTYHYRDGNHTGMTFATVYIQAIPASFSGSTLFYNNNGSGIVVQASVVEFAGNSKANFSQNTARIGGAMTILGNAWIVVNKGTQMIFNGNHAAEKGGAIFATQTEQHYSGYSHTCFIRYFNPYVHPRDWDATFTFSNNSAFTKQNSIYAASLLPCLWPMANNSSVEEDITMVFCWEGWEYDQGSDCANETVTSPVALERENRSTSLNFFSGRPEPLDVTALDDRKHNVTKQTIFTASSLNQDIDLNVLYVSDNTLALSGSPGISTRISLETFDSIAVSIELTVSILPCPVGFVYNSSTRDCKCYAELEFGGLVECSENEFQVHTFVGCCISTGNDTTIIATRCPFTLGYQQSTIIINITSPVADIDKLFCRDKLHRKGRLCSECEENYGIEPFSATMECVPCKNSYKNWLKYFAQGFLPSTVFFLAIILFHIGVTSAPANAFVFFSQVTSLPLHQLLLQTGLSVASKSNSTAAILTDVLLLPYGLWNLDFSYGVVAKYCLDSSFSGIDILALQYLSAIYPLILVGIAFIILQLHARNCRPLVCICRPFCILIARVRRTWQPKTSVVDAFATALLLSYTKLIVVSLSLLTPARVFDITGEVVDVVLKYDPSIHFFQGKHVPYGIISIIVLLIFGLISPIILLLYPFKWFQQILNRCRLNSAALQAFADTFQGCYKNGTNGSPDRRFFAGLYFLFRIVIFVLYTILEDNLWAVLDYSSILYVLGHLCFTVFQPYKEGFYNCLDACFMALLAIINIQTVFTFYHTRNFSFSFSWISIYGLTFVPLVYISGFIVYRFVICSQFFQKHCVFNLKCCKNTEEDQVSLFNHSVSRDEASDDDMLPHRLTNPQLYGNMLEIGSSSYSQWGHANEQSPLRPRCTSGYGSTVTNDTY